jgi:hypothetical protein
MKNTTANTAKAAPIKIIESCAGHNIDNNPDRKKFLFDISFSVESIHRREAQIKHKLVRVSAFNQTDAEGIYIRHTWSRASLPKATTLNVYSQGLDKARQAEFKKIRDNLTRPTITPAVAAPVAPVKSAKTVVTEALAEPAPRNWLQKTYWYFTSAHAA